MLDPLLERLDHVRIYQTLSFHLYFYPELTASIDCLQCLSNAQSSRRDHLYIRKQLPCTTTTAVRLAGSREFSIVWCQQRKLCSFYCTEPTYQCSSSLVSIAGAHPKLAIVHLPSTASITTTVRHNEVDLENILQRETTAHYPKTSGADPSSECKLPDASPLLASSGSDCHCDKHCRHVSSTDGTAKRRCKWR